MLWYHRYFKKFLLSYIKIAVHKVLENFASQAVFNDTEEFILSIDEPSNEVCFRFLCFLWNNVIFLCVLRFQFDNKKNLWVSDCSVGCFDSRKSSKVAFQSYWSSSLARAFTDRGSFCFLWYWQIYSLLEGNSLRKSHGRDFGFLRFAFWRFWFSILVM